MTAFAIGEGGLASADIHVPTFVKIIMGKASAGIAPSQLLLVFAEQ